jgi:hypothetical protein
MSDVKPTPPSAVGHPHRAAGSPGTAPSTEVHPVHPVVSVSLDAPAPGRQGSPWRWVVALFTTALMVVGTLGIGVVATTSQFGAGSGPSFLPATAIAYAEARLDLPGDQREDLIAFLGAFPGFADPASFDTKLDEAVQGLLGGEDAPLSWEEDIKPWFGGQVMFGVPELPEMSGGMTGSGEQPVTVSALGVTDRAALDAAIEKLTASMGGAVTTEPYGDTTITVAGDTAFAPTDDLLVFSSDVDAVKTSLDVLAGTIPSLADDPEFAAVLGALPEDRLGAFVLSTGQVAELIVPLLEQQTTGQPGLAALGPQLEQLLAGLPPYISGVITVDPDHLTASILADTPEAAPEAAVRQTDLAAHAPSDSIVYVETRDVGTALNGLVAGLKPMLTQEGDTRALQQIEALLGSPLEDYLSWVGDLALSVSVGLAGPSFGIVASVTDEETAQQRVDSLLTLIRIVSSAAEDPPLAITQDEVDGVTVTTIELTEASGQTEGLPVEPRVSVAVDDGHFYLGLGDFAAEAVTRDPADSLASSERYGQALEAIGAENGGHVYADLASVIALVEAFMPPADRERLESQLGPYLESLDILAAVVTQAEGVSSASMLLFVQ